MSTLRNVYNKVRAQGDVMDYFTTMSLGRDGQAFPFYISGTVTAVSKPQVISNIWEADFPRTHLTEAKQVYCVSDDPGDNAIVLMRFFDEYYRYGGGLQTLGWCVLDGTDPVPFRNYRTFDDLEDVLFVQEIVKYNGPNGYDIQNGTVYVTSEPATIGTPAEADTQAVMPANTGVSRCASFMIPRGRFGALTRVRSSFGDANASADCGFGMRIADRQLVDGFAPKIKKAWVQHVAAGIQEQTYDIPESSIGPFHGTVFLEMQSGYIVDFLALPSANNTQITLQADFLLFENSLIGGGLTEEIPVPEDLIIPPPEDDMGAREIQAGSFDGELP